MLHLLYDLLLPVSPSRWPLTQDKPEKRLNLTRNEALIYVGVGAAATLTPELTSSTSMPVLKAHRADEL